MDVHVHCADQAVKSHDGLTAFSALPNARVLPAKERRHPLRALRSALSVLSRPAINLFSQT